MASKFLDAGRFGLASQGLDNYEQRFENDAGGNPIYAGWAKPGSATSASEWRIKKFTYDVNDAVTRVQLAEDNANFAFSWDDRANFF